MNTPKGLITPTVPFEPRYPSMFVWLPLQSSAKKREPEVGCCTQTDSSTSTSKPPSKPARVWSWWVVISVWLPSVTTSTLPSTSTSPSGAARSAGGKASSPAQTSAAARRRRAGAASGWRWMEELGKACPVTQ